MEKKEKAVKEADGWGLPIVSQAATKTKINRTEQVRLFA